jgi:hypothetical protein
MKQKEIRKIAGFIRKLKPRKLNMNIVAATNKWIKKKGWEEAHYSDDPRDMKPNECTSAGCVMGWMPRIFPKLFQYVAEGSGSGGFYVKFVKDGVEHYDRAAMEVFLDIPGYDASILFGPKRPRHHTPKQVADNLEYYAEHGKLPEKITSP